MDGKVGRNLEYERKGNRNQDILCKEGEAIFNKGGKNNKKRKVDKGRSVKGKMN